MSFKDRLKIVLILLWACLLLLLFTVPTWATDYNVKVDCGAAGNGVADDTAEINTCIGNMNASDTLFFPSGTYLISSALSAILVNNVRLFGELSGATKLSTIQASGTGYTMLTVGSTSLSSYTLLTTSSSELDTTFDFDDEAISLVAGDYFWVKEGDENYGGTNFDGDGMTCSVSGCRGEVLKVASIAGDVITVTTAAHYFYDLSLNSGNDPRAAKLQSPTVGVTIEDLILDGGGNGTGNGVGQALQTLETADLTLDNLELRDLAGIGLIMRYHYNSLVRDIVLQHCAGTQSACFESRRWGHFTIDDMNISLVNDVASSFGFSPYEGADGTFTDVYVNKDDIPGGSYRTGRGAKFNATSYITLNNFTVTKVPVTNTCCAEGGSAGGGDNGISLEYYSSNNTFNNCTFLDNGGNNVQGWNEGDVNNRFNNCSFSGGGIYQVFVATSDDDWKFVQGSVVVRSGQNGISNCCPGSGGPDGLHVEAMTFTETGGTTVGIQSRGSNACINDNTFTGIETAIDVDGGTNVGSGNTLGGGSSDLTAGDCASLIEGGGPGPLQSPGPLQVPGPLQTPGPLQVPAGN